MNLEFLCQLKNIASIAIGLFGIGIIIGLHEFGHYLFARLFGVRAPSFSIGMGPKLISKKMDKKRNEWKYFDHIRRIRNKITHYSGGTEIYNDENLNGVTIDNAKKAIEMVRIMVKHLYNLGGNDNPDWVDQKESEIIN